MRLLHSLNPTFILMIHPHIQVSVFENYLPKSALYENGVQDSWVVVNFATSGALVVVSY